MILLYFYKTDNGHTYKRKDLIAYEFVIESFIIHITFWFASPRSRAIGGQLW